MCGRCCNADPELEAFEVFKYSKNMISSLYLTVEPVYNNKSKYGIPRQLATTKIPENKIRKELQKATFSRSGDGIIKIKEFGMWAVRLGGFSDEFVSGKQKRCSQLSENNECIVHKNKPLVCRLVPAPATGSDILNHALAKQFIKNHGCNDDNNREIIFTDGKPSKAIRGNTKKIFQARQETSEIAKVYFLNIAREFYAKCRKKGCEPSASDFRKLIFNNLKSRIPANDPIVLSGLIEKGIITIEDFEKWFNSQPKISKSSIRILEEIYGIQSGGIYRETSNLMEY